MDPITISVTVTATPAEGEPFTAQDLAEAVEATLFEVFPVDDGQPVVPVVKIAE